MEHLQESYFILLILTVVTLFVYKRYLRKRKWNIPGINRIIKDNENYIRLSTCLNYAGRRAALDVVFKHGLARDAKLLYKQLLLFQPTLKKLKVNNVIRDKEWQILFPQTQETHFEEFDISLILIIIQHCTTPPSGGWRIKAPKSKDIGTAAYLMYLRAFRNKLSHYGNTKISDGNFNTLWGELMNILTGLQYQTSLIQDLQSCPLDATFEYYSAITKSQYDLCYDRLKDIDELRKDVSTYHKDISKKHDLVQQIVDNERNVRQHEVLNLRKQLETLRSVKEDTSHSLLGIYDRISSLAVEIGTIEERMDSKDDADSEEIEKANIDGKVYVSQTAAPTPFPYANSITSKYCREINLSGNKNLSVEQLQNLWNYIQKSQSYILDNLILSNCNLSDAHMKVLGQIAPYLCKLDLSENKHITVTGWKYLTDKVVTSDIYRLEDVDFRNCDIDDRRLASLSDLLPKVKVVSLRLNKGMTPLGLKCISNVLQNAEPLLLEMLDLMECDLTNEHLSSVCDFIPLLKSLSLQGNTRITSESLKDLYEALSNATCCKVEELTLTSCNFKDEDMEEISKLFRIIDRVVFYNNMLVTKVGYDILLKDISSRHHKSITEFHFSSPVTDDNLATLSEIFVRTKHVLLYEQNLSSKQLEILTDKILNSTSSTVEYIYFVDCTFDDSHFPCLVKLIVANLVYWYNSNNVHIHPDILDVNLRKIVAEKKMQIRKLFLPEFNLTDAHVKVLAEHIKYISDLDITRNKKISPNGFWFISQKFSSKEPIMLSTLNISECNVTDDHMEALLNVIPVLSSLDISYNKTIRPSTFRKLSSCILSNTKYILEYLNLSGCNLTNDHLQALSMLIPSVCNINLDDNNAITNQGWRYLSNAISSATPVRLEELSLANCGVDQESVFTLLRTSIFLKTLNLNDNKSLEPMKCFTSTIQVRVNYLDLSSCNLKDSVLTAMCWLISDIEQVNLSYNTSISVQSLDGVCRAICDSKRLILGTIELRHCNLTDDHLAALSNGLPLMENVDLEGNKCLTKKGWRLLSNAVAGARVLNLEKLDVADCNIGHAEITAIREMIPKVRDLIFNKNKSLTVQSLHCLADILDSTASLNLQRLSFDSCNFSASHMENLRPVFNVISQVSLRDNIVIGQVGLKNILKEVCPRTCKLEKLVVEYCNLQNEDLEEMNKMLHLLKELQLKGNRCLTRVGMQYLCSKQSCLTQVGVESCLLKEEQILGLHSLIPNLKNLDLSNHFEITSKSVQFICDLIYSTRFNRIESLNVSKCNLVDADIKAISQIISVVRSLDITGNKYISPNGFQHLSDAAKSADVCMLDTLDLSDCNITDNHLKSLSHVISVLTSLNLTGNRFITHLGWQQLTDICSDEIVRLETLNITNCNLTFIHLKAITKLCILINELIWNNVYTLTSSDFAYIATAISSADQVALRRMEFFQININKVSVQLLSEIFPQFEEMYLEGIRSITPSTLGKVTDAILRARTNHLEILNMRRMCYFTDEHVNAVSRMAHSFSLIDFSVNRSITVDGYKTLANVLQLKAKQCGFKLDCIKLEICNLSEEHVKVLKPLFPVICELCVCYNKSITPNSLNSIAEVVSEDPSCRLDSLDLSFCEINHTHIKCMANMIPLLKKITFDWNTFTVHEYKLLSDIVYNAKRRNMELISFRDCDITDVHICTMPELISSVKEVNLSQNRRISSDSLKHLSEHISNLECNYLEKLVLRDCNMEETKLEALSRLMLKLKTLVLDDNACISPHALYNLFCTPREEIGEYTLSNISLLNCYITDEHLKMISPFIPYMVKLDLSTQRYITPVGLKFITTAVIDTKYFRLKSMKFQNFHINKSHINAMVDMVPLIRKMDLSYNKTLTPDALEIFCKAVTSASKNKLKVLKLRNINLCMFHLDKLVDIIPLLEKLDISSNKSLSPSALSRLSDIVISKNYTSLREISLRRCNLREKHLKALSIIVPRIEVLDLSKNKLINPIGMKYISNSLQDAADIKLWKLSLVNCNLKDQHLEALSPLIIFIKHLNLYNNKTITPTSLRAVSEHLMSSQITNTLESIELGCCNLNETHFDHMAGLLQCVNNLDLTMNRNMTVTDMEHLSIAISEKLCRLKSLHLNNCNLNDDLLKSILPIIYHVEEIDLTENKRITSVGLNHIAEMFEKSENVLLTKLILADCNLQVKEFRIIGSMLSKLKEINLKGNKLMTCADLTCLTESICRSKNVCLESVDFSDCDITDSHIKSMIGLMPYLKKLVLDSNKAMTCVGLHHASKYMKKWLRDHGNLKLQELHLKNCSQALKLNSELSKWNDFLKIVF